MAKIKDKNMIFYIENKFNMFIDHTKVKSLLPRICFYIETLEEFKID